jgi:hypothetical protein
VKCCQSKTKAGRRCRAAVITGSKRCVMHTLGFAQRLGAQGGRNRARRTIADLKKFAAPASAEQLQQILAESLTDVRDGRLDPRAGNSISCLANAFLKALETADIEVRLRRLEGADRNSTGKGTWAN